jgi:hypothetical protein
LLEQLASSKALLGFQYVDDDDNDLAVVLDAYITATTSELAYSRHGIAKATDYLLDSSKRHGFQLQLSSVDELAQAYIASHEGYVATTQATMTKHNNGFRAIIRGALEAFEETPPTDFDPKAYLSIHIEKVASTNEAFNKQTEDLVQQLEQASKDINISDTADPSVAARLATFIKGVIGKIRNQEAILVSITAPLQESA